MTDKRRVLFVENRHEWASILQPTSDALNIDLIATQSVADALHLLDTQQFETLIVDLTLTNADHDFDGDGTHDGLQVLIEAACRFPTMHYIVISNSISLHTLKNTPGVPSRVQLISPKDVSIHALSQALQKSLSDVEEIEENTWDMPLTTKRVTLRLSKPVLGPIAEGLVQPSVGSRPGRARILLVEDHMDWQARIAHLLEEGSYFWRLAPSYDQAVERLQLETFHIILLNLTLGPTTSSPLRETDGWRLLDHLVTYSPKSKIVVVTDNVSSMDVARLFMNYHIKGFLDKRMFSESELRTIIRDQVIGSFLRIQTLGGFRIWRDGKLINNFGHPLAETLIKVLLSRRGESISVDELIEYVCVNGYAETTQQARQTLGEVVSAARLALEPDLPRPNDSKFILRSGANYMFHMINLDIDAEQLRQFVSDGRQFERRGEADFAMKNYQAAQDIYRGDYLPNDRLARWAMQERSSLQTLYIEALNRLADLFAAKGDLTKAVEVATTAQQVDSYVESTYRRLMRYHSCLGDKAAALGTFRRLEILFKEYFNEEPSVQTVNLYQSIERGDDVICYEERTSIDSD